MAKAPVDRLALAGLVLIATMITIAAVALVLFALDAEAMALFRPPPATATAHAPAGPAIPAAAQRYRRDLARQARLVWGVDAPVATIAAQLHQESGWNPEARSGVGACGLAQFMPKTAEWIGDIDPELDDGDCANPTWALRAVVRYDLFLWRRARAANPCEQGAMALSGYNGGSGWVAKDVLLAARNGADPLKWFGHVERFNAGRSASAFAENRGYPRRILHVLEPVYVAAGWGEGLCA